MRIQPISQYFDCMTRKANSIALRATRSVVLSNGRNGATGMGFGFHWLDPGYGATFFCCIFVDHM